MKIIFFPKTFNCWLQAINLHSRFTCILWFKCSKLDTISNKQLGRLHTPAQHKGFADLASSQMRVFRTKKSIRIAYGFGKTENIRNKVTTTA